MKVLIYSILIILLIAFGFFLYEDFFQISISLLEPDNVIFESRTIVGNSNLALLFTIILGILPLLYLLVQKTTNITFIYKGLIASIVIVLFGLLIWRLRIFGLNAEFEQLSSYDLPNGLKPAISIDYLKFEIYVLMGFIVGTLVSILIFRDKNKSLLN